MINLRDARVNHRLGIAKLGDVATEDLPNKLLQVIPCLFLLHFRGRASLFATVSDK
jgi:hypothetical protein